MYLEWCALYKQCVSLHGVSSIQVSVYGHRHDSMSVCLCLYVNTVNTN